ncbi:MAG: replicative DNA helicase [Peptococcaceae bacterium]|nr:replicative DNA helicase [Peptococcaceae bacterium]
MSENYMEQSVPFAEEAEAGIISAMFKDREVIQDIVQLVRDTDFYKPENAILFKAILEIDESGQSVDLVTMTNKLRKENLLEKAGGVFYLGQIAAAPSTVYNVKQYAKIVQEKSTMRQLIRISDGIRNRCFDDAEPVESILDDAERLVLDISKQRQRNDVTRVDEIVPTNLEKIEEAAKQEDEITGIPSGFIDLDHMTNGWQRSDLIILAARPAMGKTALCLNMAANAAIDYHYPVAIFSLEMSKEQLVMRMLAAAARIDQKRLRTGQLNPDEWGAFLQKIGPLTSAPIYIDDTPAITIRELRAKARRLQSREGDLGLILVDYLQLMGGSGNSENRQQEVSEISRSLKALARELNVPIIALSQLSRTVEQTKDKRPQLSHLRESGSLEQDADIVLFIHREEYYNEDTDRRGIADVIIAKHRNGPTGTVELAFQNELTRFDNLIHEGEYGY